MDTFLKLEVDSWGVSLSTAQVYVSFTWLSIVLGVIAFVGYKLLKKWKSSRVKPLEISEMKETIDLWA